MVFAQQRNGAIPALLACAFLAFCAAGASAQGGPAVVVGESPPVRPGRTATLTIQSVGAPGQRVQLTAAAEFAPAWLAPATWQSGPAVNPGLTIDLSPPAGAAPGTYQLAIHATNDSGFTTATTAFWRVLAPSCAGAVEYDDEGICRECPPNHVPNAAKTDCVP